MSTIYDVAILFEHPLWHKPLFDSLETHQVSFQKIDLKKGVFSPQDIPQARLYYNLVSPSAYLRGNQRAIPFAWSLCRSLEMNGNTVLNGTTSMALEFSKSAQIALLDKLGIDHPQTVVFNSIDALKDQRTGLKFPMILKPEQGGSGARMFLVNSLEELEALLNQQPELWEPDNLLLLQEKLEYDVKKGITRMEFIGCELLYAMRVITNGAFNLCPSVLCNPEDDIDSNCELIADSKPEFYPDHEVSTEAVEEGKKIMKAAGHATGSVEFVETVDGRRVFYDINSNSNLRESIAVSFNKQPFDEVVNYLLERSNFNRVFKLHSK